MNPSYHFGPLLEGDCTRFRLWAPGAKNVSVEIRDTAPAAMIDRDGGWKECVLPCAPGARYRFRIGETAFPDPASRLQDGGVHGWSVVCPPVRVQSWKGRPWTETVFYELHVGLFGGFDGVAEALPRLAGLGITAIELMPIAAFPGARNWGYDGVLPFAPSEAYGPPEDLRELIVRAHDNGVMVFLDVVYNHFGPDGNYLPLYAPTFFRDDLRTPWGSAIDFRQTEVRQFFGENALYWLQEFGFDGLRFDAVHAMRDEGWLPELASTLRRSVADRPVHLVLENDDNDTSYIRAGFNAQWNDDFHHVFHVLLTGECKAYYRDFCDQPIHRLVRVLSAGFDYQGEPSANRKGQARGTSTSGLAATSFVAFLQNHDQIGNRPFGERLTALAEPDTLRAAIAVLLLSPQIPLLFMGEEVGSRAPFYYCTDHGPELAQAVRDGRSREFSELMDSTAASQIPDPNAPETFAASDPFADCSHADEWTNYYRDLLRIRREHIVPHLENAATLGAKAIGEKALVARWQLAGGAILVIACNLGASAIETEFPKGELIWGDPSPNTLLASTTLAWIVDA